MPRRPDSSPGLSFGALCGALSLWAIALRVLLIPVPPHDFWWHMAQGRAIAASGRVPLLDSFSFTRAGAPFFDQPWLAQWAFFELHARGGIPLLIVAQAACVLLAYALLWLMARDRAAQAAQATEAASEDGRESGARVASLILLGVTVVSFDNWLLRPQTLVIALFALWLWTLECWRRGSIRPAAFVAAQVALMILWANSHGSFPLALVLNGATLLGAWLDARLARTGSRKMDLGALIGASAAAGLATAINPRGLQVLGYVRRMLFDPSNRFSAEWLSPTPRSLGDALFFAFALAFFLALAHGSRRPSWADSARAAAFFWLAITSGRYILWFALVTALPLADALGSASPFQASASSGRSGRRMNTILAGAMWLLLVPLLPWFKPALALGPPIGSLLSEETPVRAVQVLAALQPRRLWHNAACGSYLTWAAPEIKVWIDTRFELYPPRQWRDYARAASGDANVLDEYNCDMALVDRVLESPLEKSLAARGWKRAHRDARFSIWKRAQVLGAAFGGAR